MPYGRFCALKIFQGSKAMISLKQEVLIFNQIKDKLQEGMRQLFPSLLEVECKPQPFPYLALEFAGSSVSQVLIQNGAFTGSAMQRLATQLRFALQALLCTASAYFIWISNRPTFCGPRRLHA